MKTLEIGKDKIVVDSDDVQTPRAIAAGLLTVELDSNGKVRVKNKATGEHLHRILTSAQKGRIVIHLNGDTLDFRKENLKQLTTEERGIYIQANLTTANRAKGRTPGSKNKPKENPVTMVSIREHPGSPIIEKNGETKIDGKTVKFSITVNNVLGEHVLAQAAKFGDPETYIQHLITLDKIGR